MFANAVRGSAAGIGLRVFPLHEGGRSGRGRTPRRLYKIPSYIRLALHVINKATLLSLHQFEKKREREEEKSCWGTFCILRSVHFRTITHLIQRYVSASNGDFT